MPKYVIDYSNTIIYKLCCKDTNITDIYIGKTTNFTNRKRDHKKSTINRNNYNFNVYKFIRSNGGWSNWDMIKIEIYKCDNALDASMRERYWIEELKPTLNIQIPLQTKPEYDKKNRENNKEIFKEKSKNDYERNKDRFKEKINCNCGSCFCIRERPRHERSKKHLDYINSIV